MKSNCLRGSKFGRLKRNITRYGSDIYSRDVKYDEVLHKMFCIRNKSMEIKGSSLVNEVDCDPVKFKVKEKSVL